VVVPPRLRDVLHQVVLHQVGGVVGEVVHEVYNERLRAQLDGVRLAIQRDVAVDNLVHGLRGRR